MIIRTYRWCLVATALCASTLGATSSLGAQQHMAVETVSRDRSHADETFARPVTVHLDRVSLRAAIDAIAEGANVEMQYQAEWLTSVKASITLHATKLALGEALDYVLAGTNLRAVSSIRNVVTIKPVRLESKADGVITGTVIDTKTKRPLRGVAISLDEAARGAMTKDDGSYRLVSVTPGEHRVHAKMLGYTRLTQRVTVSTSGTTTLDIGLEPATMALDQVVVTGTVVATELKAVPNAITVITAKQIEERGITRIEQLFRGDVPGLFARSQGSNALVDEVFMFSRGATALSGSSVGTLDGTNPIKTYVDGVELANPAYLSQIDPHSIERIEILTGPQASTIYGSNAMNGVMQVFTKRGSGNKPQLLLNMKSGVVHNNFRSATTPQHDYDAQLNGVEGRFSYNAGSSWNYMGAWTPAKQTARTTVFGGGRLALPTTIGCATVDATFRRSVTRNRIRGADEQGVVDLTETGWRYPDFRTGLVPGMRTLVGQTFGATLNYAPTNWWSHEIGIAQDASDNNFRQTSRKYVLGPRDSSLQIVELHYDKRSLRYNTTARIPVTTYALATITLGADNWQNLYKVFVGNRDDAGSYKAPFGGLSKGSHNTGGFIQTQVGFLDHFFVTYGLRAEWNPDFGDDALPSYAPRYGIAYTTDLGPVTAKMRASYGRSTRPPAKDAKLPIRQDDDALRQVYGAYDRRMANPMLGPEYQQGGEGGLELYFGGRASLVITRYNQMVDALIAEVSGLDSARSLQPHPTFFGFATCEILRSWPAPTICSSEDADGYGYALLSQNVNTASIRNQGWELQGNVTTGPLTTRGTYSWTKSRSLGVPARYRANFPAAWYPMYVPGASFNFLPEHTWAIGMTYTNARTTLAVNVTGVGQLTNRGDSIFVRYVDGGQRLTQNSWKYGNADRYINMNRGYALMDLTATHRFSPRVESLLEIQNLGDHYTQDYNARFATIGRQTRAGFRIRL